MSENRKRITITVWDSSSDPSEDLGLVYLWNGYAETKSVYSLLRYVENHGERIRRKYVSWIHELGESQINGKRLIDHLALEDGFSYWWLTTFVEKNPLKTSSIIDAIRLLAFEEIVVQKKAAKVILVSADRRLHEVLRGFCHGLGVVYDWERLMVKTPGRFSLRKSYQLLPQTWLALGSLVKHLRNRWRFRRVRKQSWFSGGRSLLFCSYFIHLDQMSCASGRFHSYHWGRLPKFLCDREIRTNWIQHYLRSSVVPDTEVALDWVQSFNKKGREEGLHTFLDAYLSCLIVLNVLRRWVKLNWIRLNLGSLRTAFVPEGSHLSLWPIMRRPWLDCMCGSTAMQNLLWIELFDAAMRDIPKQKRGFYLCENQAWERALIHAWEKNGHGQLIGVVHSTVRFWDLRCFSDPRTICSTGLYRMPQPELIALNGRAAVDSYLAMDFPKETIVECEALRYEYLNDLTTQTASRKLRGKIIRVLILGDGIPSLTISLLQLLGRAMPLLPDGMEFTIKSHPSVPVKSADFPNLNLTVTMNPLGNILQDFDIAYSSNQTSAAVDAYLAGLPVVVKLDDTQLNLTPLRGLEGVVYVTDPAELVEALRNGRSTQLGATEHYFYLDKNLPRWRALLGLDSVDVENSIER